MNKVPKLRFAIGASFLALLLLSGYEHVREENDLEGQRLLGPEKLEGAYTLSGSVSPTTLEAATALPDTTMQKQEWLGDAVLDSLHKCQAFTARLRAVRSSFDLALDVATLGLAGAAAITVPARSANLLAALAGISTGTRAAFDTDVYQQNTAPLIVQQINKTYYPQNENLTRFISAD